MTVTCNCCRTTYDSALNDACPSCGEHRQTEEQQLPSKNNAIKIRNISISIIVFLVIAIGGILVLSVFFQNEKIQPNSLTSGQVGMAVVQDANCTFYVACSGLTPIRNTFPLVQSKEKTWCSVHIKVKNTGNKSATFINDIVCVVDGQPCRSTNVITSIRNLLGDSAVINKGAQMEGDICFEISNTAKQIKLVSGDNEILIKG